VGYEAASQCSLEMLGPSYPVTQHHIPDEWNLQQHFSENLKIHTCDGTDANKLLLHNQIDLKMLKKLVIYHTGKNIHRT